MKTNVKTLLQQKKYVLLPLLLLPSAGLLIYLFYGLGPEGEKPGGTGQFNAELPLAQFRAEQDGDKLAVYMQAWQDSLTERRDRKRDAYLSIQSIGSSPSAEHEKIMPESGIPQQRALAGEALTANDNASRIDRKLEELSRTLDLTYNSFETVPNEVQRESSPAPETDLEMEKLEKLMRVINRPVTEESDMKAIDNVLEKILDVQHPERVRHKLNFNRPGVGSAAQPAISLAHDDRISTLSAAPLTIELRDHSFLGWSDDSASAPGAELIYGEVHQTQQVGSNSILKLRLASDILVKGKLYKTGQLLFGRCQLSNQRLQVTVPGIMDGNSLLPISFKVFDLDGLEGIAAPHSPGADAAAQGADQVVQQIDIPMLESSMSAQALSAGMQAATGLMRKKIKTKKVTVRSGYKVILVESKTI